MDGTNLIFSYPVRIQQELVVMEIFSASQKRIQFDDNPNLRNVLVLGVSVREVSEIPNAPNGQPLEDPKSAFFTFVQNNTEQVFSQLPVIEAMPKYNNGNKLELKGHYINFPKSYVEFSQAFTPTPGNALVMTFYYAPIKHEDYIKMQAKSLPNSMPCV